MRVVINGGMGRMGGMTVREFRELGDQVVIVDPKALPGSGDGLELHNDFKGIHGRVDAVVDFSTPQGVQASAVAAKQWKSPLVVGVTGLDERTKQVLDDAGRVVPVLIAPNLSLGVLVMHRLVAIAARLLQDYDIEVVETHHRFKADAPSGTALSLANHLAEITRRQVITNRSGARKDDEIGVASLRGGGVVGEHSVRFLGELDGLEVSHRAFDRRVLAKGAVFFTRRMMDRKPGLWSVDDLV